MMMIPEFALRENESEKVNIKVNVFSNTSTSKWHWDRFVSNFFVFPYQY
jgi:hypothetical protein